MQKILYIVIPIISVVCLFLVYTFTTIDAETGTELLANPQLQPDFVMDYTTEIDVNVPDARNLCVSINQGAIWEDGDNVEELTKHLISSSRLYIDGRIIMPWDVSVSSLASIHVLPNEDGSQTGPFGGPIMICANKSLSLGIHSATIITNSLSSQEFEYSWGFEVKA